MLYKCQFKKSHCQYNEVFASVADKDCDEACEYLVILNETKKPPSNFMPIPVHGDIEKILSYRVLGCKGCEWHPDVCKHCHGSLVG